MPPSLIWQISKCSPIPLIFISEIEDIEPLIELISQFQGLEELNLSNNLFTQLPADLSSWHAIANINLSNIQIEDFEACVHSLSTLRNLKSLYINLFEESQVDQIMRILPDLEFLNGLPVDREALNESMQSERNLQ
jgi:Leucine-rich repeat (LRR) protein